MSYELVLEGDHWVVYQDNDGSFCGTWFECFAYIRNAVQACALKITVSDTQHG
jgi:hypothetical protein